MSTNIKNYVIIIIIIAFYITFLQRIVLQPQKILYELLTPYVCYSNKSNIFITYL